MALRLELKQTKGLPKSERNRRWYFETGRRTLGRSADCDWQIPDPHCTVSKLHCVVTADRAGFVLCDKSSNGSKVDGVLVREGETARLSNGSIIGLGNFAFTVLITGAKTPEFSDPDENLVLSDETLTISAILADIAPSGGAESSGLPGAGAKWHDTPAGGSPVQHRSSHLSASRRMEIGWRGPSEPMERVPILPEDWDLSSDCSSRFEHAPATQVSIPIARARKPNEVAPESEKPIQQISKAPAPIGLPAAAEPVAETTWPADLLRHLEALTGRCEEACVDSFAAFDLDADAFFPATELGAAAPGEALRSRLEAVLSMQITLRAAIGSLLDQASRMMEPPLVEARVNAEPGQFWRRDGAYWHAYKAQFERNGRRMTLRDLFREAVLRSLHEDALDEAFQGGAPGKDMDESRGR
ncbi:FHA domain-containing protein [Chelativorans sp. AA-79]|uniref:FHA domain-containing protein n=1 Tax=Chelativorans sp. AA-79 TaxID=3028735 RepID=UPI0023F8561B|nr:FHA domain-containing protein [Chelativorans sp. AA-79]WEX08244.1 FHA domain-containing protein [Chelativorans sp. AA-79]